MYRGILLPFSSDNDTIDFIFGVINWKELADQQTTDDLLLEINQALESAPEPVRSEGPLTAWADGPADTDEPLELATPIVPELGDIVWPTTESGDNGEVDVEADAEDDAEDDEPFELTDLADDEAEAVSFDPDVLELAVEDTSVAPAEAEAAPDDSGILDLTDFEDSALLPTDEDPATMELADWLASAREYAAAAQGTEDRSRMALYAAIGRAYDFSLDRRRSARRLCRTGRRCRAHRAGPRADDAAGQAGVRRKLRQDQADRICRRTGPRPSPGLPQGTMADYLAAAPGGLKGTVAAERKMRREDDAAPAEPRQSPNERLARKLRKLDTCPLGEVASQGSEFTLLVARRMPDGAVVLLGEVADDAPLLERAARRLLG